MTEEKEKKDGGDATSPAPAAAGGRRLFHALLASAFFAMLTAFLQFNLIPYGTRALGLSPALAACLAFLSSLGIGAGKFLSDRLSGRDIEFGIVPLGALLLAAAFLALSFLPPRFFLAAPLILLAGAGAGLFMAPIDGYIRRRARGCAPCASAALRAGGAGALLGAGLVLLNYGLGFTAGRGFAVLGLAALALAAATLSLLPDFLLRFLILAFTRLAYRLRVTGLENVPVEGPALLVCNHISYADAIILIATQRRRLRFLINREVYDGWKLINPVFRLLRLIPIDMRDTPKKIVASLQAARKAMDQGDIVVIFAEGALTRTGMLREFRKGFTKIMKNSGHPIIPVYLGGAWGTVTSYYHGSFVTRWKGFFRHEVSVLFGSPLPASASAADVRLAVMELSCAYFEAKRSPRRNLGRELVKAARASWDLKVLADSGGAELTGGGLLTGALDFAAGIEARTAEREHVGLLLPPSAGGALANFAVTLAGRVPVNLNYSEPAALAAAVAQCGIRTIVTSKAFLARPGLLPLPAGSAVYLEDLAARPAGLLGALKARLAPAAWLARGQGPDDTAAVFFSSGSTGAPKGVLLSHHNILSNIESLRIVLDLAQDDKLFSALPLFHPLGYTAALWYPVLNGLPVCCHADPLEAGAVARLARESKATVLFTTPSLLRLYTRKATKEDFAALRRVLVGAEKLKASLAAAFEAKFGLRPLEGYGAAELAPVAALSVPHAQMDSEFQTGWKAGSVGLPLPGVAMKVVDPVTGERLPPGGEGILLVKGPNVMKGYLGRPDLTAAAIKDGWYRTDDVASIDEEGFVTIEDRSARFTRVGGELVPHLAVEEALQDGLGTARRVVAAASVPDGAGGEKVAVLYCAGDPARLRAIAAASALPPSWRPGEDAYYKVNRIPVSGGRPDLAAITAKARALAAGLPS